MSLLFSGFNGFGQWPVEQDMIKDFTPINVKKYFESQDKIEKFDWSIEWAYNVFIINSKIIIKGFSENLEGKSEILSHPNGGTFTNVSCNDKFLLLFNNQDKNIWKYFLDPDVDQKWKQLPNFLNSEREITQQGGNGDNADLNDETILKIVCGVMIIICLTSKGRVFNIPSEISTENIVGKVIDVCCGYEHAVLLTDQGSVYTLGGGSRCQLGQGSIDSSAAPHLVEALAGVEIVKVAAGGWHSCAISSIGDLYTWGWNDRGQLGIRHEPDKELENAEKGASVTLEDNCFDECFDTKKNDTKDDLPTPNDVSLGNFEIGKRSQSYVFNDDSKDKVNKKVKSSESNEKDFNSHAIPNLIDIYDSNDGKIMELNIVDVSCGSKHTAIKLDDGSIWGTGCNKYGQLGFDVETIENVNHFTMLNVKAKNAILKCGIWATVLLTLD